MCINIMICVRACDGESDAFPIKVGLHQGSALSLIHLEMMVSNVKRVQNYKETKVEIVSL
jgi:polyferredoxin